MIFYSTFINLTLRTSRIVIPLLGQLADLRIDREEELQEYSKFEFRAIIRQQLSAKMTRFSIFLRSHLYVETRYGKYLSISGGERRHASPRVRTVTSNRNFEFRAQILSELLV